MFSEKKTDKKCPIHTIGNLTLWRTEMDVPMFLPLPCNRMIFCPVANYLQVEYFLMVSDMFGVWDPCLPRYEQWHRLCKKYSSSGVLFSIYPTKMHPSNKWENTLFYSATWSCQVKYYVHYNKWVYCSSCEILLLADRMFLLKSREFVMLFFINWWW